MIAWQLPRVATSDFCRFVIGATQQGWPFGRLTRGEPRDEFRARSGPMPSIGPGSRSAFVRPQKSMVRNRMDQRENYGQMGIPIGQQSASARAEFITRTYNHLMGAIVAFVGIEMLLFGSGVAAPMAEVMLGGSWLLVLGAFMLVGWVAQSAAMRAESLSSQYLALGGYVVAQAIVFVPMLYMADQAAGGGVIQSAGLVTLLGFGGLTAVVFTTRKDFSFLGGLVRYGFILAIVAIVVSLFTGFDLGTWFSVGMIGLAGAAILYDTSNVLHHYPEDRYVSASLSLFASVAVLFWYVLRFFMASDD
jgi:FtsH-binding integral membrane protein